MPFSAIVCLFLSTFILVANKPCLFYEIKEELTGSTDLSKEINSDNLLLVSTIDGTLTAIEQKEGKIRWKHQDEPTVKVPLDTKEAINPIILPDPKDGSLYLLGGTGRVSSLKKLPFTIPELVASSPCRSSDGILYTGKKTDQWFLVEPRSGQREPVLGWGSNPADSNTCPMPAGTAVYIGRTQYEILMLELNNESKRKWNVTFFGYAAEPMSTEMRNNYDMVHFAASSTGMLLTMDRISGQTLWKVDLGAPVVAVYLLTPAGLVSVPFTSVALQTFNILEKANPFLSKMRLYPTLYIGEHPHGLYALPSLVDKNTVTITASQTSPLLLEGPSIDSSSAKNTFQISGQNIRVLPDELDKLHEISNLQSIIMDKNSIIYLGHYNVPDYSPIQLRLSGHSIVDDKTSSFKPASSNNIENYSNILDSREKTRSVEIQTEDTDDLDADNIKPHSTQYFLNIYWQMKNWLNKQDNKGLKLALIIVVGCMISMFWYVKAQFREFHQLSSQGSTGSAHSLSGPVTAYLEELDNGQMRVGKITFQPDTVLGRGCEGTFVYKGEFEGRAVAVKRLLPECFSLADREVSLLKESDAHPHVIRYHCTERDRQFRYIALELCVATLFDYVTNKKQTAELLPPISEMDILRQATSGIAHLHSLDIVHRDIKPQNVLLWVGYGGSEVRAMISDFGLCKKLQIGRNSFSRRSGITGTEGWIAPEMLHGKDKTTTAVDMFSLGCVFYFVLSNGKHPFGEPLRRQANILSDLYQLTDLQGPQNIQELAKNLIQCLIASKPSDRPPAVAVLSHPLFWTKIQTLTFLQDVSDRVEKADLSDYALNNLETCNASVIRNDWRLHVSDAVASDLRRYRSYKGTSVRDLLRALRNKKHHYHELPIEAQQELGEIPDCFIDYWTSRFPQLLIHTWLAMQCVKTESAFRRYYPNTYQFDYTLDRTKPVQEMVEALSITTTNGFLTYDNPLLLSVSPKKSRKYDKYKNRQRKYLNNTKENSVISELDNNQQDGADKNNGVNWRVPLNSPENNNIDLFNKSNKINYKFRKITNKKINNETPSSLVSIKSPDINPQDT